MKKFHHPRRSVILLFLLGILTLGIYPLVATYHIGKEINLINEGKEGYKKSMNFIAVFFLGIITLGIVPIVWFCRVARKFGEKAWELDIKKPHTSALSYFLLNVVFVEAVIPPVIGWFKFIHTINAVETRLNQLAEEAAVAQAEAEILVPPEEQDAMLNPGQEERIVEGEKGDSDVYNVSEAAPAPVVDEPAPEPEEEEEDETPAEPELPPFEYVTEVETPEDEEVEGFHIAGREETRKWRVRLPDSDVPMKVFDTEAEAIAYAKGVAARNNISVKVKK